MLQLMLLLSLVFQCASVKITKQTISKCPSIRDANINNGGPQYCNCTYSTFRIKYSSHGVKLTSFLEKLKSWKCPQFVEECRNRSFNFNHFTFLVYEKFCNETNFMKICRKELNAYGFNLDGFLATRSQNSSIKKNLDWETNIESPCLQVFSYTYGMPYYEVARPFKPFCDSVWCGFNQYTIKQRPLSTWECLPDRCRTNLVLIMVCCGILAVSIVFANFTIISVILRNRRFPTSQLIYKLSLASADILVGFFVVPSFIITLYMFNVGSYQRLTISTDTSFRMNDSNDTFDSESNVYYNVHIKQGYRNFFGLITTFSLFNSIYTLMFASYDRLRSLSNPLKYDRDNFTMYAKWITILQWIVSFVFALLPIFVAGLGPYEFVAGGVLVSVFKYSSIYYLGIGLAFPLVLAWLFTIGVWVNFQRQIISRLKRLSRTQKHNFTTERQLSITVSVMIVMFTLSITPGILLLFIPEFLPQITPSNIHQLDIQAAATYFMMELVATIILSSNSLWNAFIYSYRNKRFRKDAALLYHVIATKVGLIALKEFCFDCLTKNTTNTREMMRVPEERFLSSASTTSDCKVRSSSSPTSEKVRKVTNLLQPIDETTSIY